MRREKHQILGVYSLIDFLTPYRMMLQPSVLAKHRDKKNQDLYYPLESKIQTHVLSYMLINVRNWGINVYRYSAGTVEI